MELHVFIEVMAPIPEGYLRMAHAMEEVKKFLIPVRIPTVYYVQYVLLRVNCCLITLFLSEGAW